MTADGAGGGRGPALLILNQMAGPMTWELAEDMGKALGCIALLTGHPDTLAKGSREEVQLHAAPPYQRGRYPRRLFSWLHYFISAFLWLWRWPASTPILFFSNPPILPWLGYLMRRIRGQRYAVMVHDIYPDILVGMGPLSNGHLATRVWRWLNRRAYESAQVVMTLGEYMAANLDKQFDSNRTPAGSVRVIYPWVDTEKIRPIPKEENWFAREHAQVGKLTVMYSGNMGLGHDIETMLEAAQRLKDELDIHFMFIGAGPKWKLIQRTIDQRRLSNTTLLPWQPEEVIPYSLATADVALVSIEAGIEGLMVPSKAIYSLASGSALLALSHGQAEQQRWVTSFGCGYAVPAGDANQLASRVLQLSQQRAVLSRQRKAARASASDRFCRSVNTSALLGAMSLPWPSSSLEPRIVPDIDLALPRDVKR